MLSLYHALLAQHARQLTSLACAEQTIAQIHNYFEDVVLENNLAALVIESLPFAAERPMRDVARVREIGRTACQAFFFVHERDVLNETSMRARPHHREPVLIKTSTHPGALEERFVVIADARFSALLASVRHSSNSNTSEEKESGIDTAGDEVLWTFEPDIVYSALEYLMARVAAERPLQSDAFSKAVRESVPKATSLQLTVSVTTKLARLLQEQTGREVAVNRIATAIRSSLDLSSVLQTTVAEVGRALKAQHCALRVEGEHGGEPLTHCYFRDEAAEACEQTEVMSDLNAYAVRLSGRHKHYILDGRASTDAAHDDGIRPLAAVPFLYRERFMGILMVRSDDQTRVWGENEVLLMRTVADQVAVAVVQARLFAQMQQQA
nr:GAF domain-containing protein [Pyrinomonadaceae bacterium]